MKKRFGILLILAVLGGSGGGFYLYQFSNDPVRIEKKTFELVKGMSPSEISSALESQGLIRNRKLFYWWGRLSGGWRGIKSAEYEIPENPTPRQIFKIMRSGIGIQRALLVREGENIFQVAQSLEKVGIGQYQENLSLLRSTQFIREMGLLGDGIRTLEGYLLPNTYFYDKKDSPESMIRRMVQSFLKNWTKEWSERAKLFRMNRREVITLASIIEKETGASEERAIISSVFHNRIQKKMRLQSDPTTIYGIWESYDGNLRKSDLLKPGEYNTYTLPFLPVGPISNPHPDSIRAALFPAETRYLFFVSKNDGTHVFSHTYEEHSRWVKKLQLDQSAREGKSWRDLGKNRNP